MQAGFRLIINYMFFIIIIYIPEAEICMSAVHRDNKAANLCFFLVFVTV